MKSRTATKLHCLKKTIALLSGILAGLAMSCEEEPEHKDFLTLRAGIPTHVTQRITDFIEPLDSVEVELYGSREDFYLGTNALYKGYTPGTGDLFLPLWNEVDTLWCRAKKDNLNNLRFQDFNFRYPVPVSSSRYESYWHFDIRMSTTPTRLQIYLKNGSAPVAGYCIQLYLTNDDLITGTPPQGNLTELGPYYGNYTTSLESYTDQSLGPFFQQMTNEQGVAIFDQLEPRMYWLQVLDEAGNPVSTDTNQLPEPLPDNENLTTVTNLYIQ